KCAPLDDSSRSGAPASVRDELVEIEREPTRAHEKDDCAGALAECVPVDAAIFLVPALVAGCKNNGGGQIAVCERNAGIGRNRDGGADTRNHLPWDAFLRERFSFFRTAPEDEGVPALEANDRLAGTSALDQQIRDSHLRPGPANTVLAHLNELGMGRGV